MGRFDHDHLIFCLYFIHLLSVGRQMTGTMTLSRNFGPLVGLADISRSFTGDGSVVYAGSGFQIVFAMGLDPAVAKSFLIKNLAGDVEYASADYSVSLQALDDALSAEDSDAALDALFANAGTLTLGPDAELDLQTFHGGMMLTGNDLGTSFTVAHGPAIIEAGGGDDVITICAVLDDGIVLHGGDGNDTLIFSNSHVGYALTIKVEAGEFEIQNPSLALASYHTFTGIEFFRGGAGDDMFFGGGLGHRFQGGNGVDQFYTVAEPGTRDIVDYTNEGGSLGIVANLAATLDTSDLGAGFDPRLALALIEILGADSQSGSGSIRDSFGNFDYIGAGLEIVGSARADFFYGGDGDDVFDGGSGDDHFYGGIGNDTIIGGDGIDTFYLGTRTGLGLSLIGGIYTLTSADGIDVLSGVEYLSFADEADSVAISSLLTVAPHAVDDVNGTDVVIEAAAGIAGDASASGNVLDNDTPQSALSVTHIAAGSGGLSALGSRTTLIGQYGSLDIAADGSWTYSLDNTSSRTQALKSGQIGHDIFTYRVSDGSATDEAHLDISITGSNDRPIGGADGLSTNEDTVLTTAVTALLANDSDVENEVLTLVSVQGASHGTVKLTGGNVVFTPSANFHGTGGYTYIVRDASGGEATVSVTVDIASVNDAPNGVGSTVTLAEDSTRGFTLADFGYSDPDGDSLHSIIITTLPGQGSLRLGTTTVAANQVIAAAQLTSLNWTPPANVNGNNLASFTFKVRDTGGGNDTDPTPGRIVLNVTPVNDAPAITSNGRGSSASIAIKEGSLAVTKVTATDIDSSALTYAINGGADASRFKIDASTGVLTLKAAADFEVKLDAGANNIYDVVVRASDGMLAVQQALAVTIQNVKGNSVSGDAKGNLLDAKHTIKGGKLATAEEDRIDGKGGNDTIKGGGGKDTLTGGSGADRFVFDSKLGPGNIDTITDFKRGTDKVALDDAIFKAIGSKLDAGEFYGKLGATAAKDTTDRIIYDNRTGNLYYDADGIKAGSAPIHFATLSNRPAGLDHTDFMIV